MPTAPARRGDAADAPSRPPPGRPGMTTPCQRIGGEAGVRHFCRHFHALMDTLPEARACRAIHPASLAGSKEKLFEYLACWFSGSPLLAGLHGAPMLRRRRLRVPIGTAEVVGWLICFEGAWTEVVDFAALEAAVMASVVHLARDTANVAPGPG
jgi:hemoglobin